VIARAAPGRVDGRVDDLEPVVDEAPAQVAGYVPDGAELVVEGLCPSCSS
jgi:hypothetical protein